MRYILSPLYRLDSMDSLIIHSEYKDEAQILKGNHILVNNEKGNIYVLNETIYQFLSHFVSPKSLAEVNQLYQPLEKSQEAEMKQVVSDFAKKMMERKILVPENELPKSVDKNYKYTVGDKIDNYTITELIANKSNVDIYKATDEHGRVVVIKLVHPAKFSTDKKYQKTIDYLTQEYKILKQLEHIPEVVKVYELKENNDEIYLVMDYIEGDSLIKWITRNDINYADKTKIISQLLNVFAQIHESGVVHGDIHPSNFLINEKGLHIIDFGLGVQPDNEENQLVKLGGVSHYMPPERVENHVFGKFKNASNYQSEVYQLGVLIYFIIYHKTPYSALTWKSLSNQILNNQMIFESTMPNGEAVPKSQERLLSSSINKDLNQRFQNAVEMKEYWENIDK